MPKMKTVVVLLVASSAVLVGLVAYVVQTQSNVNAEQAYSSQTRTNPYGGGAKLQGVSATAAETSRRGSGNNPMRMRVMHPRTQDRQASSVSGIQQLSPRNEQRLTKFVESQSQNNYVVRDKLEKLATEKRDSDWATMAEAELERSILSWGRDASSLQVSRPVCGSSICMVMATGGYNSELKNADWNGVISNVVNERWFFTNFDDMSTTVKGDRGGILYVTFFVRKN